MMKTPILKFIILFSLLHLKPIVAQEVSPVFKKILNDSSLNTNSKKIKFDSLLKIYQTQKNYNYLLGNRFELIKWYYKNGELNKAIDLNKENIFLLDSLHTTNISFLRRNLYGLGLYQIKQGDNLNAVKTFHRFTSINKVDKLSHKAYYFIAEQSFISNDYYLSIKQHKLAFKIAKKDKNYLYCVKNIIQASYALKLINTPKSIHEGIELLKEAENIIQLHKKSIHPFYQFYVYQQLGNMHNDRKDFNFDKSTFYHKKAIKLAEDINDTDLLAEAYNSLGVLYLKAKKKEAINYLFKGLSYNSLRFNSYIYRNISSYHFNNKDKILALESIQKSINAIVPFNHELLVALPERESALNILGKYPLISSLSEKAKILIELANKAPFKEYSNQHALEALRLADHLVDFIRLESNEEKSKLFWRKTASEIYTNAVKACAALNLPEEAFYFIEKSKALLLLEDVNRKKILQDAIIPERITKRESYLKNNILTYVKQESNSIASDKLLLDAKQSYNLFIDSLDNKYQLYYKPLKPASVINLKDFQSTIESNKVYLQYSLDDNTGHVLFINSQKVDLVELKNPDSLKLLSKKYRELIEYPLSTKQDLTTVNNISLKLYNLLIPKEVQRKLKGKSITIIPDNYLQNIPFEALQTSKDSNSFLIYHNEINYAYSISFLKENQKVVRDNKHEYIGFAPVEFPNNLSTLSQSDKEVVHASKLFSSNTFLNKNATKQNFHSEIEKHKIIHIASHANANDSISPWIAFSDSKLNLEELYTTKNTAELVVLSACNTSLGEFFKGEGVISLSRGFFNTGANSVIPTLWNVNNKSTASIINDFYKNIKTGQTKSAALHQAKLKYLNTHSLSEISPHYWASLILIGDSSSLKLEAAKNYSFLTYIFLFCILLVISIYLFRRKKVNKYPN